VYNICSGTTWYIKNVLKKLLEHSAVRIDVKQDPSRMRPSDVPVLQGDNAKFTAATSWERRYDFDTTLNDILEYWRNFPE